MIDWQARAHHLASELAASGAITDAACRSACEGIPRHLFVPRFWVLDEYNAPDRLLDGASDGQRETWLDAVYCDQFLATQWMTKGGRRIITSSASLSSLVARMLQLAIIQDGNRVLEIGTGTGYNTALLCHRVGGSQVATIDIDPKLVAEASGRLRQLGYEPLTVVGDGAAGLKDGAPFDRIISTCASPGVPSSWIEQLAVGGKIVAPFTFGGALAALVKIDADTVEGGSVMSLLGSCRFARQGARCLTATLSIRRDSVLMR